MASSSSTPLKKYEVFLSFRGEDTRNNFVSHLHMALKERGIITFFDEHDLEKGQLITPGLIESIEESEFAIIVFSENYASSTWCLDELVKIMERYSNGKIKVIPIFYHVDPSDIRKQNNSFAVSFAEYDVRFKDNMEKVKLWKDNLREAASISGHHFIERITQQAQLITKIVEDILTRLPLKASVEGLFGIEQRLKDLRLLLAKEKNNVCYVGIWGMGGIGKTTIAQAIFQELVREFEGGCFLEDVCKKEIVYLQGLLLSKVLPGKGKDNISSAGEGSNVIRERLRSRKVLLVLDNVDNIVQLESLAKDSSWFGNGSRIIITTRDRMLLNDVNEIYEIKPLPKNEAIKLFCQYAFRRSRPDENLTNHSDIFVRYAGGLPLALKVLGSYLRGKQEDVWRSTLMKLKDDPDKHIIAALKISFDSLSDTQKNIFLDIACFFRGHYKDNRGGWYDDTNEVLKKLDSFGFHPVVGIIDLIDKSLIQISSDGQIQMHDLIQDMGHDIVRKKANQRHERYSRLWDSEDIINVLTQDTVTDEVEALVLRDTPGIIELSESALRNMKRLRLLELHYNVNLVISPNYLPNSLRWLSWPSYPGRYLPETFQPRNLVSLNLSKSPTLTTFPVISCMPNLEFLNLSHCTNLLEVPPSAEVHKKLLHLKLDLCKKLEKFERIEMKSLETLDLSCCRKLQTLPEFHSDMTRLRTVDLRYLKIREVTLSFGCLTSLQEINMSTCHLGVTERLAKNFFEQLLDMDSEAELENSEEDEDSEGSERCEGTDQEMDIEEDEDSEGSERCEGTEQGMDIEEDEDSEGSERCEGTDQQGMDIEEDEDSEASKTLKLLLSLPSLQKVNMSDCDVLKIIFPESIGCITSLQELDLQRNKFVSLPESINHFSSLQVLLLSSSKIEELPELPTSITKLVLDQCTDLTGIPHPVDLLLKYQNLSILSLINCNQLATKIRLDPWNWVSFSEALCTRQEVLQVLLPSMTTFEMLYQKTGSQSVTLSPSWYNDKFRGFVIFAICEDPFYTVWAIDGLVELLPYSPPQIDVSSNGEHNAIFYIPVGKITTGIDKKNCCLLEVNCGSDVKSWGIHLVYDGDNILKDMTDLITISHDVGGFRYKSTIKVYDA